MTVYTHNELEGFWELQGGRAVAADTAAAIAQAESGGNPTVIDNSAYPQLPGYHRPTPGSLPEYSVGLWQINVLAHPQYDPATLVDPNVNAQAAIAISSNGMNFQPWSTFQNQAYAQYLANDPTGAGGGQPAGGGTPESGATGVHQFERAWGGLMRTLAHTGPHELARSRMARAGIRQAVR